jgi:hypothetical protein
MYDLIIYPIAIQNGEQHQQLSGFKVATPPKRASRSRTDDRLVVFLTLRGGEENPQNIRKTWLEHLIDTFYQNSGSVTAAMRSVVEVLNESILETNLKAASQSGATAAAITMIALHHGNFYIVQSGWTHAYCLTPQGLEHFFDSDLTDRGLGFSRKPKIRFYQAQIESEGYLFMTDTPPATWTESQLMPKGLPSLEQLRRRLLNQAPSDFRLGFLKIKQGKGITSFIQPEENKTSHTDQAAPEESPDEPIETQHNLSQILDTPQEDLEVDQTQKVINEVAEQPAPPEIIRVDPTKQKPQDTIETSKNEEQPEHIEPNAGQPDAGESEISVEEPPEPLDQHTSEVLAKEPQRKKSSTRLTAEQRQQIRKKGLTGLVSVFDWWNNSREKISGFFKGLSAKKSDKSVGEAPRLSRKAQIWIAILVPIVMVSIAAGIYIGCGRRLQYETYYTLAEAQALSAAAAGSPEQIRSEWLGVIDYLDQAEEYKQTDDILALRVQAQNALDQLDGAIRLRYLNALNTPLSQDTKIIRIITYGYDLYLLDSTRGEVIHGISVGSSYDIDQEFLCKPGNYSGGQVEAIVDMVSLPPNNPYQAHLMGLDAKGNVVYCAPYQSPIVQQLPLLEGKGSGVVRAAYEGNTLYVLNREMATVLVYRPINGQFLDSPGDYFGNLGLGEKPDVSNVSDIEVNGQKLYLLNNSGSVIECTSSGGAVRCQDTLVFTDARPGREDQPLLMPESSYVAIVFNDSPMSTISILDANNADIYQFSQIFRLSRRLRPDMRDEAALSETATAFTIGINRTVFLAFGNQVFHAYLD